MLDEVRVSRRFSLAIDEGTADCELARELLRWGLTGTVTPPYAQHAPAGQLLAQGEVTRIRRLGCSSRPGLPP